MYVLLFISNDKSINIVKFAHSSFTNPIWSKAMRARIHMLYFFMLVKQEEESIFIIILLSKKYLINN